MKRGISIFHKVLLLSAMTMLILSFQNCDQNFEIYKEKIPEYVFREMEIMPSIYESRPAIHLTTIVDNSTSMTLVQDKVLSAFGKVAYKVNGFAGQASVYTTSQLRVGNPLYDDKISMIPPVAFPNLFAEWDDNGILKMTPEKEVPLNKPYILVKQYLLSPSFTGPNGQPGAPLIFNTGTDFDKFVIDYSSAIKVGVHGNDKEQGLCTLLRAAQENAKFKGAFHAYIIATNENDQTSAKDCLAETRTEISKEPVTTNPLVACDPNNTEFPCEYYYEMGYTPRPKKKYNYSYRSVTESIAWRNNEAGLRTVRYTKDACNRSYEYYQPNNTYTYTKTETYTFQRKQIYDGIVLPEVNADNTNRIFTATRTIAGQCGTGSGDCSDLRFLAYANPTPTGHGFVSCNYTCTETSKQNDPKKTTGTLTSLEGVCTQTGWQNCPSDIASTFPADAYNCRVNYSNSKPTGNYTEACTTEESERACNEAELEVATGKVSPYPLTANSCKSKCVSTSGTFTPSGAGACPNVNSDANGTYSADCDAAQISALAAAKGFLADEIGAGKKYSCQYTCTQSIIGTGNYTETSYDDNCTAGACTDSEFTTVKQKNSAVKDNNLVSCDRTCPTSSRAKCVPVTPFAKTQADLCQENSDLWKACNTTDGFKQELTTCKLLGSQQKSTSLAWNSVPGETQQTSMVSNPENVVDSTFHSLKSLHGDRFYVASFIYPPNDPNCAPPLESLSTGTRYKELTDKLGPSLASQYPLCVSDYSPALSFVFDLIVKEAASSYILPRLAQDNFIDSVELYYDTGDVKNLNVNQFKWDNNLLTVHDPKLLLGVTKMKINILTWEQKKDPEAKE